MGVARWRARGDQDRENTPEHVALRYLLLAVDGLKTLESEFAHEIHGESTPATRALQKAFEHALSQLEQAQHAVRSGDEAELRRLLAD
jgi:hypothetical protein